MKNYFLFLASVLMVFIAKFIPFSSILGSQYAFFSASTIFALIVTRHVSLWTLSLFLIPFQGFSISSIFIFLMNRMPLFFASWFYARSGQLLSLVISCLCFGLFIYHPIGLQAWPYAVYWLIPVLIYASGNNNIFLKALSAVFVAHAVGSAVWIYTHDMTPEFWLALIPIVAVERLIMALSVTLVEHGIATYKASDSRFREKLFFRKTA